MENMDGPSQIFNGKADVFKGITIATDEQNWSSPEEFEKLLVGSLEHWQKTSSVRGVWIRIPLQQADLVGIVAKHGFVFHHTQPHYVMMTKWLPEDEENMLPGYASHYIGVGGFVLNEKKELLVIQELYMYGKKSMWKLPGGTVDPGEHLPEAVCREVYEETGVKAEFISISCFRHLHNFRFGRSDIYFICVLKPLSSEINMCPSEIAECKWMDIEEYLNNPCVHDANKYFARQCLAGLSQDRTVDLHPEVTAGYQVYSILPKAVEASHPGSSEEAPHAGNSEKAVHPGSSEEAPHPGSSEKASLPGSSEEAPHPGSSEKTVHPLSLEEAPHPGSSEKAVHPGSSKEALHPGSSEEASHPGSLEKAPRPGNSEEASHPRSSKEALHLGSLEEAPHPGSSEGCVSEEAQGGRKT